MTQPKAASAPLSAAAEKRFPSRPTTRRHFTRLLRRGLALLAPGLLAATLLAASPAARADTVAFTLQGGNLNFLPGLYGNVTIGYTFTLVNPVLVSQLGVYDGPSFGPGLVSAVPVTIWNSLGVQLARATVPAGTGPEVNGFLYTPLTAPVALPAGTYTIGAYLTNDEDLESLTRITGAAGITYGASRSSPGDRFPGGNFVGTPNSYFGPNFEISTVPEPTTWLGGALLGGLAVAGARRSKLRRA